ncbi:hypothetical protein RBB80_04315 [Tunturiibacter gelidiferens]
MTTFRGRYQKISPEIGNVPTLPTTSGATGDLRIQYRLTTLDQPVVPRSGINLLAYTKGYTVNPAAPGAFPVTEIQVQDFFRLSTPSSIFVGVKLRRSGVAR